MQLRRIASAIDNSRNPSRDLVAKDLKILISSILNEPSYYIAYDQVNNKTHISTPNTKLKKSSIGFDFESLCGEKFTVPNGQVKLVTDLNLINCENCKSLAPKQRISSDVNIPDLEEVAQN